jgi:small nuclear ribonucleoprotein (snRNP)-like protein
VERIEARLKRIDEQLNVVLFEVHRLARAMAPAE